MESNKNFKFAIVLDANQDPIIRIVIFVQFSKLWIGFRMTPQFESQVEFQISFSFLDNRKSAKTGAVIRS